MNVRALLAAVIANVLLFISCNSGSPLSPRSGGKAFEVLVVGDIDSMVFKMLTVPMEGLPQEEQSFDVSTISNDRYNYTSKMTRNIVVLTADSNQFSRTMLRYEKDIYAQPQMIVYIHTPSARQLREDVAQVAPRLRALLTRAEVNRTIASLHTKHNAAAEQAVRDMFGIQMLVPPTFTKINRGDQFLWISDNVTSGMSGLCLYTIPEGMNLIAGRDSAMRRNMRGEEKNMYVTTVNGTCRSWLSHIKGIPVTIANGLWEMNGDAMGGPFILHAITDSATHTTLVAEAIVYEPSGNKRNKIHYAEASLYTIKRNKDTDYGRK